MQFTMAGWSAWFEWIISYCTFSGSLPLCTIYQFQESSSSLQGKFFLLPCFEMPHFVCLHVSKISLFVVISFKLKCLCFSACLFAIIKTVASKFHVGLENFDSSCIAYQQLSLIYPSGNHNGSYFAHTSKFQQNALNNYTKEPRFQHLTHMKKI